MKKDYTVIACVLDRSGSMGHLVTDVLGGYNQFIKEQKKLPGKVDVSLILFDTEYEEVYLNKPLEEVPELTSDVYYARGMTALLDACGMTIQKLGVSLAAMKEEDRPENVIVFINTDGEENSSHEYSTTQLKEMIEEQQSKYNWKFMFMGANQDSFDTGTSFGISKGNIRNFSPTCSGTQDVYTSMSYCSASLRGFSDDALAVAGVSACDALLEDDTLGNDAAKDDSEPSA